MSTLLVCACRRLPLLSSKAGAFDREFEQLATDEEH
jgi:hypothetical protein